MVLRTIYSRYDTKDGIQTHTYSSDQVQLLIIHIDRDKVIFSGLQELVVFLLGVLILLEVVVVTQEGTSSLNVISIFLHLLHLFLLVLDSGLKRCYLCAETGDGGILLCPLLAESLAVVVEELDGFTLLDDVGVSLVGVLTRVVEILLSVVQDEVEMLHMVLQLRVGLHVHGLSSRVTPREVRKARVLECLPAHPAQACESLLKGAGKSVQPVALHEGEEDPLRSGRLHLAPQVSGDDPLQLSSWLVRDLNSVELRVRAIKVIGKGVEVVLEDQASPIPKLVKLRVHGLHLKVK